VVSPRGPGGETAPNGGPTLRVGRITERLRRTRLAGYVAMRIVRSRRSATLSLVTLISILGIAFGVMALTVVLSVTAGFEGAFQERILGLYPHLVITSESSRFDGYEELMDRVAAEDGVTGVSPMTADSMMAAHGVFRAGATIQGVEPETIDSVVDLSRIMTAGSLDDLHETPDVAEEGGTVRVRRAVEGAWMTLVLWGEEARVLFDDRVLPGAGQARIKLLDLRAEPAPVALSPRGGDAVRVYRLSDAVPFDPPAEAGAVAFSPELEIPGGDWELDVTGDRLIVEPDTTITLALLDPTDPTGDNPGGRPELRYMVEDARIARMERTAHLRVLNARRSGAAVAVAAGDEPAFVTVEVGEFSEFTPIPARFPAILLGSALAERLGVELGTEVTLVSPLRGIDGRTVGPFGMLPSSSRFVVAGVFEAGFHDHDARLAIINLNVAQRFLNRGKLIQTVAVRTEDIFALEAVKSRITRAIDPFPIEDLILNIESLRGQMATFVQPGFASRSSSPYPTFIGGLRTATEAVNLMKFQANETARKNRYRIHDWKEKNINLFRALELQKVVLTMFFLIIIIVGSFVVVGSQTMVVHEKTADIAILKAMGATRGWVRLVFTLQGLLVAGVGAATGLALGLGMVWIIDAVEYQLDASIYLIDHLPARVDPVEILLVTGGALLCTLITTQVSAGRAASKTPVEGLRTVD